MTMDKGHGGGRVDGEGGRERGAAARTEALVALGANLPLDGRPPEATLRAAIDALAGAGLAPARVSRFWRTPCFPEGAGPDYVNAAAAIPVAPGVTPGALLAALHRIEAQLGRERAARWGARTLDLDLIAFGDLVLPDEPVQDCWRALAPELRATLAPDVLVLPHPRLQERAFVLVPLAEVAPGWRHPRLGLTVDAMLAALDPAERAAPRPL